MTKVIDVKPGSKMETLIKKMIADQAYIHKKIREGKVHEIAIERPDIKFG